MGVQVPCRVHTEVPQESVVWANPAALWHSIPRACSAQGVPNRGRAPDARPRAHADIDPTEIFSGGGDRVSKREELDLDRTECETQAAEFKILGKGLTRFDGQAG